MRISLLCSDGSPLGVTVADIYGNGSRGIGVGGSEIALLTMCEQWHSEGHEVVLYNDPTSNGSSFEQRTRAEFDSSDDPDVLIVFRSPNAKALISNAKKLVWWSCDQYTQGSFSTFANALQERNSEIVCISPFHADYFAKTYGITQTTVIDLPIRVDDFKFEDEKIKNRFIFTSVPGRGLMHLHAMWPEIKKDIPDASLVITSDYRLWGIGDPRNAQYRVHWLMANDVQFKGALKREDYLKELCKADLLTYPCDYDELFCISVAEAQYAGVYPITSKYGALGTTTMGTIVKGDPSQIDFRKRFMEQIRYFNDNRDELEKRRRHVKSDILNRCHPEVVSKQWSELFE